MTIELPDVNIGSQPLTSEQARIELAIGMYAGRHATMGQAASIAGISYTAFMHELGKHGVCLNYSMEDALQDIETVRRRLGK